MRDKPSEGPFVATDNLLGSHDRDFSVISYTCHGRFQLDAENRLVTGQVSLPLMKAVTNIPPMLAESR